MILFLDTSALVKLYVEEADSETVRGWVEVAEEVACQWIAYVEARSALAAKRRLGDLSDAELVGCKKELEEDWERYHRVAVPQTLLRRAGALSEQLGVRAYDSVHLAGAEYLQSSLGVPITFGSFDRRQVDAAARLGMLIAPVDDDPDQGDDQSEGNSQTPTNPSTKGQFP